MKAALLVVVMVMALPRSGNAEASCWEQYALCNGYCDSLKSACALRCDDRRFQCERSRFKKPQRKSSRIIPA
jgi:hypothetical protein